MKNNKRSNVRKTTEQFIEEARQVHGDKYGYSKVEYVNKHTKICVICPEHGEFWQTPKNHLRGDECPFCAGNIKLTTEQFIEKARQVHGDKYDYSKVEYINAYTKVCIICPEHGEFWQTPNNHTNGKCGCPFCASNVKLTTEEFIEKARKVHGDKYDYSKVEYINSHTKVCIICPEHGEFWQTPSIHTDGICGCPFCASKKVTNEQVRTKILERLEGTDFELVNVDYKGHRDCNVTIKCKECETIKTYARIDYIRKTCPTCEYNKRKRRAIENVSKCKTMKEFRKKYYNDYDWFRRKCLLEEMTCHLEYGHGNLERLIYVYEIYIDGMKPHAYIGLTYNLEARDKQHLYQGKRDSLWKFCKEHNVAMPKPKILMDYVPEDEASQMEAFYEKQYREKGFETINVAKCGGLGGGSNHTFEEIEAIGKKYPSRSEWNKNDNDSYQYAHKHYKKVNRKNVRWVDLIIPNKIEQRKPVIGYNPKTKETRIYESIHATQKDGFNYQCVHNVCRGACNTHKGWIFRYKNNGEQNNRVKRKIRVRKPVIAMNIKTKETRIYESIGATEEDGFQCGNVHHVCNGKYKSHKGWIFRYLKDGEIKNVV